MNLETLKCNVDHIKKGIADVADIDSITIIAATKTVQANDIALLNSVGIKIAGENRAQELLDKFSKVDIEWHFIGRLQSNKVKSIIDKVDLIHSVDKFTLAEEINKQALKINKIQNILIEVNVAGEASKGGVAANDVITFAKEVDLFNNISINGLMCVMPNIADKNELCQYYLQLKSIYDKLRLTKLINANIKWLSAGMSQDYVLAAEYGSNMIRLGSALFGERVY